MLGNALLLLYFYAPQVHHLQEPEAAVQDPRLPPVQPHLPAAGAELRLRRGEDPAAPGHLGLPQE